MRAIQQGNMYRDYTPPLKSRERERYCRSYTLVLDLPDYAFFMDLMTRLLPQALYKAEFDVKMGLSIVNPIDQFNRKQGLKLALGKMKELKAHITRFTILKSGDFGIDLSIVDTNFRVIMSQRNNRAFVDSCHYDDALNLYNNVFR